ncbi:MAG: glycosyltransferase family 87 protein, partial [Halobacteriaceae archaeon]
PIYQTTSQIGGLQARLSGDMPYLYPPVFVLLFVPFTVFPPVIAGYIWDIVVLGFLVWSASVLIKTFDIDLKKRTRILLYLGIISFGPTLTWVKAGQVSGLIAALLILSAASLRSGNDIHSGVFTTLGSAVKPFYATSGAHLLRSKKRLLSGILALMVVILTSLLLFGVNESLQYFEVLRSGKGWGVGIGPQNWNAGHFNPFYILGPVKHLPRLLIVIGTAGISLHSNWRDIPVEYIFALGVAIIPVAGPTANTLALNAVIPAVLVVGLYELEQTGKVPEVLAVGILLIHIHPYTVEFLSKLGPSIFSPLNNIAPIIPILQPAIYGLGLLLGYFVYKIHHIQSEEGFKIG